MTITMTNSSDRLSVDDSKGRSVLCLLVLKRTDSNDDWCAGGGGGEDRETTHLLGAGVFCDSLGALADGMFGQLSR